jgi:hypothetical protein
MIGPAKRLHRLDRWVAMVTGASSGFGARCATLPHRAGTGDGRPLEQQSPPEPAEVLDLNPRGRGPMPAGRKPLRFTPPGRP